MVTPELMASWARTEALLLEANSALPVEATTRFSPQLETFKQFLSHNELGLALDTLIDLVEELQVATVPVIRPLLMAAENMGLTKERAALAELLESLDPRTSNMSAPE